MYSAYFGLTENPFSLTPDPRFLFMSQRHREALAHPGGMAAVMGLDMDGVLELVQAAREDGILDVANHNTVRQIVITGEKDAVKRAVQLAKEKKAKAIPLKVSGAWHSQLMQGGVNELRSFMEEMLLFTPPQDSRRKGLGSTLKNPSTSIIRL